MNDLIKDNLNNYFVAIYIRLSKEDETIGESESIQNQKLLLTKYVKEQNYNLVDIYIDDGYTGTNFERPAFKRMLEDIELGKVNMVITKDLSRLSRDYIGTGEYVEKWFPLHGVRYVALTDAIDTSIDSANNDIAPFKAILNDMYAKDLSKKIRTALHTMQCEGKWVGGCTPYGYKVDKEDKNHLIIDEIEGKVVKRIFKMFLKGNSLNEIKNILNKEKVPTFSSSRNRNFERKGKNGNICGYWSNATLKKILTNRLYTGDMVQNKRSRVSYKYRKLVKNPESKWIIVENTHDSIISKEDFYKVQLNLPKQCQRNDKKEYFLFDGIFKCADCSHNIGITSRDKYGNSYTVCNYYRKNKLCTSHGNSYNKLEKKLLEIIRSIIKTVDIQLIENKINNKCKYDFSINDVKQTIKKLENELTNQKEYLDKLYMDKLKNIITDEMYLRIDNKITSQIKKLENNIKCNTIDIQSFKKTKDNNYLHDIFNDYLFINKPKRDLILKLIDHIDIHEDKRIDIYFNFKEINFNNDNCNA